jgi:hypothetical protein
MRDFELYQAVLGLRAPWSVINVALDVNGNQVTVTVSRVIQMSSVRVIENSPPGLGRCCRFLQSHQSRFELLFEPIGMASDIHGDRMV